MDYEKLMQDEAFVKRVSGAADFGEVSKILREYGVEATEEDLKAAAAGGQAELDEAALDNVAGGLNVLDILRRIGPTLIGGPIAPWPHK